MSRSGYTDDCDGWELIKWRGAVASAIRGRRGQSFLREMLTALDSLESKTLIRDELIEDGAVCAIGAVGKSRGLPMENIDPEDREAVATAFEIPHALACEVMYMNDEWGPYQEAPEARFARMRQWITEKLGIGTTPLWYWA